MAATLRPVTDNDALGGAGSLRAQVVPGLLNVLTQGLARTIDGRNSQRYPLTSGSEQAAIDAQGNLRPVGSPGTPQSAGDAFASAMRNPLVIGVGISVAAALAVFLIVKRL